MFYLRWAVKNLLANKKRTAKKVLSIGVSISVVLACIAFIDGTGKQMKENVYYSLGDLYANAKNANLDITNVKDAIFDLAGDKGIVLEEYYKSGQAIGQGGYANITTAGIMPEYLPYLSKSIGWVIPPERKLERGTMILEARLAKNLNVKKGDSVTVKIQTDDGMINTITLEVDGVFVGNEYMYVNYAFMNIDDLRETFLMTGTVNQVKVFFRNEVGHEELSEYVAALDKKYMRTTSFGTKNDIEKSYVFMYFIYYRIFLVFLLSFVVLTFIIILNFSIQNIYYMEFRSRRKETSTLLTFGMKPGSIAIVVLLETAISYVAAFMLSCAIVWAIGSLLRCFVIKDIRAIEYITMLGGNRIVFSYNATRFCICFIIMLLISIGASRKGSKCFLKMSIRDIMSST